MPQYGVIVYAPAPADPDDLSPDYLDSIAAYPKEAAKLGGKVLGGSYFSGQRGFAMHASTEARSIRGASASDGPLLDSKLVVTAYYVLSAPDLDTAARIAALHPATKDGGVEVRELFSA